MVGRALGILGTTAAVLLAAATPAGAATLPPGGEIDKAVTANVTPDGIDFLLEQGIELIPDQFAIPTINGSQSCAVSTINYTIYQGAPQNGIRVDITSANVTPQQGYFDLAISGSVRGTGTDTDGNGNSHTNVFARVTYSGCGTSCNNGDRAVLRLNSTPFSVTTRLNLVMQIDPVTGDPYVEATSPINRDSISLSTNNVDAAGCAAIDFLVGVGKSFMSNYVKDEIIKQVNETLLPAVEEGFQSVRYDDQLVLADKALDVKIVPSALSIRDNGVSLSMSSIIAAAQPTTCVPVAADAGSLLTQGDPPTFTTLSPGGFAYDAGAVLTDDLVNQALFATWHGGLLCQTLSEMDGVPLTTELLAVAGLSGPLGKLGVEAGTPILVVVKGYEPPTGYFGGENTINLSLKRLEVSIFTTVQHRLARIVALDLAVDTGVDLVVNANNQLDVQLAIDPEDIAGTVAYGEPLGDAADGLLGLLPLILDQIGPAVAGALPTIDLGNLAGVQLVNPEILAVTGNGGPQNDNLGVFTGLAAAPGGCAASSGCGVGGGTAGCDMNPRTGRPASGAALAFTLLAPIAFVLRRRR